MVEGSASRSGQGSRARLTIKRLALFRRKCVQFGRRDVLSFPWRRRPTPYRVLLAEVLLQHTPSARVVGVFERVVRRWPTFRALADADRAELCRVLHPLGLQRRRALALIAMADRVMRAWEGVLPDRPNLLRTLPGVGPYTAGATVAVARRKPVPFVDGGIARLLRRYFGLPPGSGPDRSAWSLAQQVVRGGDIRALAWGLLDLSRTVCRARPRCGQCVLRVECEWLKNSRSGASVGRRA